MVSLLPHCIHLVLFLVISLFNMASNLVLKGCPVFLSVMCLSEVLAKLRSGMSYSVTGHEFKLNESTIYIK